MNSLQPWPTASQVVEDHSLLRDLPCEVLAGIQTQFAAALTAIGARLAVGPAPNQPSGAENRLVKINEAAKRLGLSEHYIYRHAEEFPFTVRQGRALRFSSGGIDTYIRTHSGRKR